MSKKKNEHFSGYFDLTKIISEAIEKFNGKNNWDLYIEKVVYNKPATIVFWNDGVKTVSKCSERDEYNPQIGLLLAVLKRFGKVSNLIDDWAPTSEEFPSYTEIRDVRIRNRIV